MGKCIFAFIVFMFLIAGPAEGGIVDNGDTNTTSTARSIALSWDHPSHPRLAGFTVMINDGPLIDIPGPESREWSDVVLLNVGQNVFKVRAYTTEGEYSEWSEPAYYTLYDVIRAPGNIKIEVIVTIVVAS